MTLIQAIILGIVQGATEFIPVSSSGHLEVIPKIFGWEKPSTSLILFAHIGTLIALLVYFRNDIWMYLQTLFAWGKFKLNPAVPLSDKQRHDWNIIVRIVLAVIPAGIAGVALNDIITNFYDQNPNQSLPTFLTLAAMAGLGVVFIVSEKWFDTKRMDLAKLPFARAVAIGASQAFAFLRGVSRSGVTILTAQAMGLSKIDAAKFSFLVSIPVIAGSSLVSISELRALPSTELQTILPAALAMLISAAVCGWLAIRYLLKFLSHNGLAFFGWYRICFVILALVILFS